MKRTIAYKYQLKTTPKIDNLFNQFAGAQRFVWNKILGFQNDRFKLGEKKLSYVQTANLLPLMKNEDETSWLKLIPAQTLQQTLKDLDRAYINFFQKRAELPVFKKKGIRDSFRYPDGKQIKLDQINNRIFLPKVGFVNYRNSRAINGKINSVTVSKEKNHWYISINFTQEYDVKSVAPINSIVGIDIGITRFASLSTGDYLEPMNSFRKSEIKTIKLSKILSRKNSSN
jgi:putative transposase